MWSHQANHLKIGKEVVFVPLKGWKEGRRLLVISFSRNAPPDGRVRGQKGQTRSFEVCSAPFKEICMFWSYIRRIEGEKCFGWNEMPAEPFLVLDTGLVWMMLPCCLPATCWGMRNETDYADPGEIFLHI